MPSYDYSILIVNKLLKEYAKNCDKWCYLLKKPRCKQVALRTIKR